MWARRAPVGAAVGRTECGQIQMIISVMLWFLMIFFCYYEDKVEVVRKVLFLD